MLVDFLDSAEGGSGGSAAASLMFVVGVADSSGWLPFNSSSFKFSLRMKL